MSVAELNAKPGGLLMPLRDLDSLDRRTEVDTTRTRRGGRTLGRKLPTKHFSEGGWDVGTGKDLGNLARNGHTHCSGAGDGRRTRTWENGVLRTV